MFILSHVLELNSVAIVKENLIVVFGWRDK